ncbi:uncharacterized protein DNG_03337 [Cephalotrichum gorgonifer]|uniref:CFEM domain-containing protein n=1 Tax=Cephalotrichum gorgonifer TaxID=2041049 RepID=A0AAE8MU18_9PEZI|nr:uncharacterized protein DNG_03337 [Cephalotrichum gorgonifer]
MCRVLRALFWTLVIPAVIAQSECLSLTSQFPSCVAGCVTSGAKSAGCTNTLDFSCQCNPSSSAAIQAYAIGCATSACHGNAESMLDGFKAGSSICDCVASVTSEMPRLVSATDHSEGSTVAQLQVGSVGGTGDDGIVPPGYGGPSSPSPSDAKLPDIVQTVDAAFPTQTAGDGQRVAWCEEPKVATIINTSTKVSAWISSVPSGDNCTDLATKVVPTCAQECFKSKASDIGCKELDLACQCRDDIQAQLTTLMFPCILSACGVGDIVSVVAAGTSGQAAPGSEPEGMARASPSTTCAPVSPLAEDCAIYRPMFAPCGSDCLAPVVPEAGCSIDDLLCQCAPDKQAALSTLVLPCVRESCSESTRADVMWDPEPMCACASRSASKASSPTLTKTSSTKGSTTASLQNAGDKGGIEILVEIVLAVFVAGMTL